MANNDDPGCWHESADHLRACIFDLDHAGVHSWDTGDRLTDWTVG